ncbi:hypothetical protein CFP56_034697 [Quercus suber]|uniref:Uncharacterized protein n=1 Tax=Quercus suber TaxID=58331 RepID=A0AAW0JB88_QUESU
MHVHPHHSPVDDQSPTITKEVEDAMKEHEKWELHQSLESCRGHSVPPPKLLSCSRCPQLLSLKIQAVDLSKRAVHLCPNSLSCWFFHVNALFKLTEYDANAGHGPVIEACDAGLAIEFAQKIWPQSPELKNSERVSDSSNYKANTKYLENLKNEIQELQERKEEIEERAITASKNFETPELMPLPENKRKIKNLKKVAELDVDTVERRVRLTGMTR